MSHSFTSTYLESIQLDRATLAAVSKVHEYKGKQSLYQEAVPELLSELRQSAIIQSADYSNRIEGVIITADRVEPVLLKGSQPTNRDEQEVLGYKLVLDQIHQHHADMNLSPNLIRQLHRDLMKFSPEPGGEWKNAPNHIIAAYPDGKHEIRFETVPPYLVQKEMDELNAGFHAAWQDSMNDKLLLTAAYVLDFLCVHPFHDGNGRTARLLTLLLLYKAGFQVGQFISLERIIENTKDDYYRALGAADQGWHDGKHNLNPWLRYLAQVLLAAYRELEEKTGQVQLPTRTEVIMDAVRQLPQSFKTADVIALCPDVPEQTVRNTLSELGKEGYIRSTGKGRSAGWEKQEL